jgi:predicted metalloprotease
MTRSSTRIMLLCLVLSLSLCRVAPVRAQNDTKDLQAATVAAQEILSLASQRNFNAMYDRIHPDAHAVIPRAAAVGEFDALYGKYKVGNATITGGKIISWTWPVTGKTYDRTAQLSFTQPFTDEQGQQQTLSDVINLVTADGEWRWFFGSSTAFVDQAIAQYGPPPTTPLVEGDLVHNVITDLESFYRDALSYTDASYSDPKLVEVAAGTSQATACGDASTGFWAFYCPGDATIYVDDALIDPLAQQQDFSAAFVIAHEFAHHVQTLVGFDRVPSQPTAWNQVWSIQLELMADCMAGAWSLDADTRGLLQLNDVDEAITFTISKLGDPSYVPNYDPQAHGTADERAQSFENGYENGFLGCNTPVL